MSNCKNIWDVNWAGQSKMEPARLLNSRVTLATYGAIAEFIDEGDKLILETGCGSGRLCCLLAKNFPGSFVTGMDNSANSIKLANSLKDGTGVSNLSIQEGNLFEIPYPDNYFDVVFNDGVIEHFALEQSPNYVDAVKEMTRVTKSGGKIIVSVPNWYCLPHTLYKWVLKRLRRPYKYGYEKSFKHKELIKLCSEIGLAKIEVSGFYPAHRWYYFAGKGGLARVFLIPGILTDIVEYLDFSNDKVFAKKFGAAIVAKAVKP